MWENTWPDTATQDAPGVAAAMGNHRTDTRGRRRRRRAGAGRRAAPWQEAWDALAQRGSPHSPTRPDSAVSGRRRKRKRTPEEQAYREARRAANARIGFISHAIPYAAVCFFLLLVAGFRPALIVAASWGIGIALHYFFAIAAPGLRQRLIQREVSQRVTGDVSRERRSLESEHARRVEELSASIAHEIRNPITAARSLVQQMGEDPSARDNVEYASVALEELERVERSVSHLLRFAREEDLNLREVPLADVVDSAVETLRERLRSLGVALERDVAPSLTLQADPEKLRRVVINLLGNALDAFGDSPTEAPRISIQAGENLAGTEVWLRVKDNGPGMDEVHLGRIWRPFYTSKSSGTGLGLAITKKVVDAHGGCIEALSEPGAGTEFLLRFPKRPRSEQAK